MPDPDCFLLNARPKSSPLIELTETRDTRDHNHNLALDWEEKILRGWHTLGCSSPGTGLCSPDPYIGQTVIVFRREGSRNSSAPEH